MISKTNVDFFTTVNNILETTFFASRQVVVDIFPVKFYLEILKSASLN